MQLSIQFAASYSRHPYELSTPLSLKTAGLKSIVFDAEREIKGKEVLKAVCGSFLDLT